MLIIPIIPRRRSKQQGRLNAPPMALTLVAASVGVGPSLTLQFSRPVNVAAINVGAFVLRDADTVTMYVADGTPIVVDPVTIRLPMTYQDEYAGEGVLLSANADNGIVAAGDGAAWAGVSELGLPYP